MVRGCDIINNVGKSLSNLTNKETNKGEYVMDMKARLKDTVLITHMILFKCSLSQNECCSTNDSLIAINMQLSVLRQKKCVVNPALRPSAGHVHASTRVSHLGKLSDELCGII